MAIAWSCQHTEAKRVWGFWYAAPQSCRRGVRASCANIISSSCNSPYAQPAMLLVLLEQSGPNNCVFFAASSQVNVRLEQVL